MVRSTLRFRLALAFALGIVIYLSSTGTNRVTVSAQQSSPFAYSFGSAGQEYGKAATVDGAGNVIVTTLFQNTIDFDHDSAPKFKPAFTRLSPSLNNRGS